MSMARDLMAEARDLLNDPDEDYFSEFKLLRHLNRALRDVSVRARTIREIIRRSVNEGQTAYGLPRELLDVVRCAWYQENDWYPLLRRRLGQTQVINHSDIISTWRPYYYDIWGNARTERLIADVVDVGPYEDFPTHSQTYTFGFELGITGYDDIRVGDVIENVTDGSRGTVTEVDDTAREIFGYALLEGGGRTGDEHGRIQLGDTLRLTSPWSDSQTLHVSPPPPSDSEVGEERLWAYITRRHYVIDQSLVDGFNDSLEIDIELETCVLERLMYWARREELGAKDPEVQAQLILYETAYHQALPFVRQRIKELDSTWGDPMAFTGFGNVELSGVANVDGHPLNLTVG